MDRGYDDNKMFLKLDGLEQDYVICLTSKRKLLYHNKWTPATELRDRRKGKIKTSVFYRGKDHEAYLSHVKVQITASRKDIYLVLVYGITEHPMMLATNKEIRSKEDVIRVARIYFSRWKIEEYFRCKKQVFQFENFRVRKLHAINALNFYITVCMATVTNTVTKYINGGIDAVTKFKRSINSDNARRKVDGHTEARLIELACGPVPEGHSRWTIRLLEQEARVVLETPVGREAIRNALKKTNFDLTKTTTGASRQKKTRNS